MKHTDPVILLTDHPAWRRITAAIAARRARAEQARLNTVPPAAELPRWGDTGRWWDPARLNSIR